MKEKILSLENNGKHLNLKLCGMKEKIEGMTDLSSFLATWLAKELQLSENSLLVIYSVYRLDTPNSPRRVLGAILDLVKSRGAFYLHGKQILVFPDLTPEVLLDIGCYKLLSANGIKYKWIMPACICFMHSGKACEITDLEAGQYFLWCIGICPDHSMEWDRKAAKRKLDLLATPEKDPKSPMRVHT